MGAGVSRAWWVFWSWRGSSWVDDSVRFSFAGAGGLPCGVLDGLGISFGLNAWESLMEKWAIIILLLDSNRELNNHM